MADISVKEWDSTKWDAFVDASPDGTAFHKSYFLQSYGRPVVYLGFYNGGEDVAAMAFVVTDKGIEMMPYMAFSGIVFRDFSDYKMYRFNETRMAVLEFVAQYLFDHYSCVDFCNHWNVSDMRAFDWVNYHERQKGYYQILVRYTSLLDISNPTDTGGWARKRVRELDKGKDEGHVFVTRITEDVALLNRLHEMNFQRQGLDRTEAQQKVLFDICGNLLKAKAGVLLETSVDGHPAVVSCFMYDKRRAYHLFVGTDLDLRDAGAGTRNFHDSCVFLNREFGCKELDLVGANSPLRSSYKLSYGGRLVPYYRVRKVPPQGAS